MDNNKKTITIQEYLEKLNTERKEMKLDDESLEKTCSEFIKKKFQQWEKEIEEEKNEIS